jgi:hypothetical protein
MRNVHFLGWFLVVCVLGCSGDGFPVSGKVTFQDGAPVPRGQVTFISNTFSAGGTIAADGSYSVTVVASGDSPSSLVHVENVKPIKPLVDKKFNSPDTSGLVCEVKGKTTFPITVTPPK